MNVNEKGFKLYWENYHRAIEWQSSSHISHWQARARALEVENTLLRDFIRRELRSGTPQSQTANTCGITLNRNYTVHNEERAETSVEEDETVHSDCEIDEELLAFYEKTIRHKLERKKRQSEDKRRHDDSLSDNERISSMGPITCTHKSSDMALLYGQNAPKILSMELSMQINFDMNRNKSHAQLWPNIPLRLS